MPLEPSPPAVTMSPIRKPRVSAPQALGGDPPGGAAPLRPGFAFPAGGYRRACLAPVVLVVLAWAAVTTVDGPLARAALPAALPGFAAAMIDHAEVFGDGAGVLFFLAGVWALDPRRRRYLPRLACACWGSGLAANAVKLCVGRSRPYLWMLQDHAGNNFGFGGWFPLALNGSETQSFPSGHTATAVGLALGLSALYPRGRRLFALLAVCVGLQRVVNDMHFVSDTLFGAAVAWMTTVNLFRMKPIGEWFDRLERGELRSPRTTAAWRRAA